MHACIRPQLDFPSYEYAYGGGVSGGATINLDSFLKPGALLSSRRVHSSIIFVKSLAGKKMDVLANYRPGAERKFPDHYRLLYSYKIHARRRQPNDDDYEPKGKSKQKSIRLIFHGKLAR